MTFKKGDRVRCIDAHGYGILLLKEGGCYTVSDVWNQLIYLEDIPGYRFFARRFVLAEDQEEQMPRPPRIVLDGHDVYFAGNGSLITVGCTRVTYDEVKKILDHMDCLRNHSHNINRYVSSKHTEEHGPDKHKRA